MIETNARHRFDVRGRLRMVAGRVVWRVALYGLQAWLADLP
jgi:hypothetical protein